MSERYIRAHLVDASHTLIVPGTQRQFSREAGGELIDRYDDFWRALLSDGSLAPGERAPLQPGEIPAQTTEPTL